MQGNGWRGSGKTGTNIPSGWKRYLDSFTKDLRQNNRITQEEAFVLLCAVYMHDIGYRDGRNGHGKKSREIIEPDPATYHFGDFPPYRHGACVQTAPNTGRGEARSPLPRVAEAVGILCEGHIPYDNPLTNIRDDFPDSGI